MCLSELSVADGAGGNVCQSYEEVYAIPASATGSTNLGWPLCEGPCGGMYWTATCPCSAGYMDPWYSYPHFGAAGCPTSGSAGAIIGGFVYYGGNFPAPYKGAYFFADYMRNYISFVAIDSLGKAILPAVSFDSAAPAGVIYLTQGPKVP